MHAKAIARGLNYFFAGVILLLSILLFVRHTTVRPTIGLGISGLGIGLLYLLASFLKPSNQAKVLMMTFSIVMSIYAF